MSSACSVPAATVAVNLTLPSHPQSVSDNNRNNNTNNDSTQSTQSNGLAAISYEGRLSLLGADPGHPSGMDFDQAVVLRRIKAECDMLDFQSIHKDNFMGVDMSTLPLYSSGFSPNHPGNATAAGIFSSGQPQGSADRTKTPEYPSTPIRQPATGSGGLVDPAGSHGRQHQNDSGISPGSTGAAGSAASTNSGDETKKRNGHSESGGEDPAVGSGASGSPYSDHYSGDERRMLLTPTEEDDGDLMDGPEDDDDDLLDEEGSSRGASSDVVGEALSRLERALMAQSGGLANNGNLPEGSAAGAVYQCNMCSYSATSRFHFQAHLNSHFDVKCTHCDFTARTEGKLRAHIRNAHSDVTGMEDGEMGSNTRVPRVTTQGKLKTHKCKHPQCGFVAVTKLDFWEHTRTHIKAEKLLTCPHCPFVTEYRHHLEYHTRNHLNSKPFKCPKCSYSCVNKSMLNSHMKSHSNVYQFRCQDCAYATKYQHSLKLHLRKYGHTSTSNLSLNDPAIPGSENGVKPKGRRGPKKPRGSKTGQNNVESPAPPTPNSNNPSGFNPPVGTSPSLPIPFNFPLYPGHPLMAHPTNAAPVNSSEPEKKKLRIAADEQLLKCGMCDYATANKDHFSQHLLAHAAADQHHRELANLFGVIPADLLNSPSSNPQQQQHQQSVTPLKGSSTSTPQQQYQMNYLSRMLANPTLLFSTPSAPAVQQQERRKQAEMSRTPTPDVPTPPPTKPNQTPLDLSREKDDLPPTSAVVTNKHRRKGQAFKLERSAPASVKSPSPTRQLQQRLSPAHSGTPSPSVPVPGAREPDEEEEEEDEDEMEGDDPIVDTSLEKAPKKETKRRNPQCPGGGEWGGAYQCSYCDIAFKDVVMYTMHMGYHGFQDPFTCNMCGQSTHDKLAFFLHIARSSHS